MKKEKKSENRSIVDVISITLRTIATAPAQIDIYHYTTNIEYRHNGFGKVKKCLTT